MAEAATQPGVVSDRQEMLDEIYATRKEQIKQEIRDGGGDPEVLEEVVSDDPLKPESISVEEWGKLSDETKGQLTREETARKAAETAPATVAAVVEPPKKTKIKVDGQEIEIEDDKIREAGIKALQKETAADKRLEEAGRLKAEAEALVIAARNTRPDPPAGGSTVVERLTDDNFISAVKAIQYGSEAEATAALKTLIATAAPSGPEGLTVEQANNLLDFREATKWAHDEYQDVLGDPKLKSLFVNEEKRLRAAGDMRPYREIYTDIGSGLREWKATLAPAPTPAPTILTRQERKATVISIPTAAARQAAPQQVKEPTPSDIVDKMRLARHQTV